MAQAIDAAQWKALLEYCHKTAKISLTDATRELGPNHVSIRRDEKAGIYALVGHALDYRTATITFAIAERLDGALRSMGFDPQSLPVGLGGPPAQPRDIVDGEAPETITTGEQAAPKEKK